MTSHSNSARRLALTWIEKWNEGDPESIPLAETFVHTSPFGRVEGRERYLSWVKPLAEKNVTTLRVLRTLGGPDQAVIHFEMETPNGIVPVCDWVTVSGNEITEIHSFYDATELRE